MIETHEAIIGLDVPSMHEKCLKIESAEQRRSLRNDLIQKRHFDSVECVRSVVIWIW